MDIVSEIKDIKSKKEQAQTLLTKHRTQLESLTEQRDKLLGELVDDYGTTLDDAPALLDKLSSELDAKLAEAKEILEKIDIR